MFTVLLLQNSIKSIGKNIKNNSFVLLHITYKKVISLGGYMRLVYWQCRISLKQEKNNTFFSKNSFFANYSCNGDSAGLFYTMNSDIPS